MVTTQLCSVCAAAQPPSSVYACGGHTPVGSSACWWMQSAQLSVCLWTKCTVPYQSIRRSHAQLSGTRLAHVHLLAGVELQLVLSAMLTGCIIRGCLFEGIRCVKQPLPSGPVATFFHKCRPLLELFWGKECEWKQPCRHAFCMKPSSRA